MAEYYVKTTGSDSTGDGSEGNPWASPGYAAGQVTAGDKVWLQAGTYTMSVNSANVSNGYLNLITSGSHSITIEGYQTTPGDRGTRPLIAASHSTLAFSGFVRFGNANSAVVNINFDGSVTASSVGVSSSQATTLSRLVDCEFFNFSRGVSSTQGGIRILRCVADSCVFGFWGGSCEYCLAVDCTTGFNSDQSGAAKIRNYCIASGCNVGYSSINNSGVDTQYSIAYDCVSHGFEFGSTVATGLNLISCISILNGGYGYFINGSDTNPLRHSLFKCVDFSNTSGRKSGPFMYDDGAITLTENPFTDAINGDFSLNNDAGGGAVLRAILAAMPGVDTDIYPFGTWAAPMGGTSGPSRIRQGNLLGRSF